MKILISLLLAFSCSVLIADTDVVTVKGKGSGINETAALKDAYRDAVETAVGLYVDAEQMVKNDEVVEDQILTQSNAYIESYDVLKKTVANGVCTIKIEARVKTKALTKKLSTTMKTQTVDVGSGLRNLYAKEVSKKKSGEDGAALLRKTLAKLDPIKQLIDVSLANTDPIVFNKDDDQCKELKMAYLFRNAISEERYFAELVPPLREALSQISISLPGRMSLSVSGRESFNLKKCFRRSLPKYSSDLTWQVCGATVTSPEVGMMRGDGYWMNLPKELPVILVTKVNKLHTIFSCETYELDEHASNVLKEWQGIIWSANKDVSVSVSFVDGDEVSLSQGSVKVGDCSDLTCFAMKYFYREKERKFFVFAPWFLGRGLDRRSSVFERYVWKDVVLPKDALPLIKKIKVDLVK